MQFLIWALIQVLNKQTYLETKKDISKQREISYTVLGVVKVVLGRLCFSVHEHFPYPGDIGDLVDIQVTLT